MGLVLGAVLGLLLPAWCDCRAAEPARPTGSGEPPARGGGTAPIGTATMQDDGTILLQLRAEGRGGTGDALLRYPPADPHYPAIRDHLPALRPGLGVPVPPFD